MSVLQDKIAGMTEQQANKLAREIQEFCELSKHPEVGPGDYPLLTWLYTAIKLEGTIAEQIHLCPACANDNHAGHTYNFRGHDDKLWRCKCSKCSRHW